MAGAPQWPPLVSLAHFNFVIDVCNSSTETLLRELVHLRAKGSGKDALFLNAGDYLNGRNNLAIYVILDDVNCQLRSGATARSTATRTVRLLCRWWWWFFFFSFPALAFRDFIHPPPPSRPR